LSCLVLSCLVLSCLVFSSLLFSSLRKRSEFKLLLGLHLGVYWHEQTAHKPIKEAEQLPSSTSEGYHIVQDPIFLSQPAVVVDNQSLASPGKEDIPDIDSLSIVGSPPENIRSRGLYAMENVPQKGSMAYFVRPDWRVSGNGNKRTKNREFNSENRRKP
jgi:hypothetical protein